jgi:hypothetical protein
MNGTCILAYCIVALFFFCRGQFWEGVAFLGLAELASVQEAIKGERE